MISGHQEADSFYMKKSILMRNSIRLSFNLQRNCRLSVWLMTLFRDENQLLLVEISYGFAPERI